MRFSDAFTKEKNKNEGYGTYIILCKVLAESGSDRDEIEKIFHDYMPKDEYARAEKQELVDYLVEISNNIPE